MTLSTCVWADTDLRPEMVHVADAKKTQTYLKDGLFTGGDRAIDGVVVKDIRRAANPAGYDRIVIDLEGVHNGEPTAIARAPYYQVAINPEEKRVIFTIWGYPKLSFDAKKVAASFKKSAVIQGFTPYPKLDEQTWSFVLGMNSPHPVEVFELTNPARVILDVKNPSKGERP